MQMCANCLLAKKCNPLCILPRESLCFYNDVMIFAELSLHACFCESANQLYDVTIFAELSQPFLRARFCESALRRHDFCQTTNALSVPASDYSDTRYETRALLGYDYWSRVKAIIL